jgi:hypothetical protein
MSQENVKRFREVFETFNRLGRDPTSARELVKTLVGFFDPHVIFEPQQAALQGTYRGHEGLRQWLVDLAEHYGPGRIQFSHTRNVGGQSSRSGPSRSRDEEAALKSTRRSPSSRRSATASSSISWTTASTPGPSKPWG